MATKAGRKRKPMGRPRKHQEGAVSTSVYLPMELAEDLKRFTAYLISVDGRHRSYSDVLVDAVRAFRPFKAWQKQKGAPGT